MENLREHCVSLELWKPVKEYEGFYEVRNCGGLLWKIGFVFFTVCIALICAPFTFVICGIAYGIKTTLMELVFFFDMIFETNYHYKFFKEY